MSHHRLDQNTKTTPITNNEVTTGKSGFVRSERDSRTSEPDEHYPHLPETDYHHDKGAQRNMRSPGPYHGDDYVSHGWNAPDVHSGGKTPDSYVYGVEVNEHQAAAIHADDYRSEQAVPVRVIEVLEKVRRITHQIITPVLVPPGTAIRVVGKDVTRTRLYLIASTASGIILVQPDVNIVNVAAANIAAFGFPITNTSIRMDTEEEIWAYCASDATAPGIYVSGYAEYVRSTESNEEAFRKVIPHLTAHDRN